MSMDRKIVWTTMGRGIPWASKRDNGPIGSRRNASDIAGLITAAGSDFCFLAGCSRSSVAGRFREGSSSKTRPFCRVRRYWSIRFDNGPAAFVLD
jgi:hypothetical protein